MDLSLPEMRFWRAFGYPCMSAIAGQTAQFSLYVRDVREVPHFYRRREGGWNRGCRDEIPARKHVTNFGSNASCLISGGVKPTACIQNQDAIDVMNQDNTLNYKVCVGQKSKSG